MAEKIMIGLSKIEIGLPLSDGSMATSFTQVGETVEDSASLTDEAPTETEFMTEESDQAIYISSKKGKTILKWSTFNLDANNLVKLFGGTVTGDGTTKPYRWEQPATVPNLEYSIRATMVEGGTIEIPRAKFTGIKNFALSKNKLAQADITATVLKPKKVNTSALAIVDPALPLAGVDPKI